MIMDAVMYGVILNAIMDRFDNPLPLIALKKFNVEFCASNNLK